MALQDPTVNPPLFPEPGGQLHESSSRSPSTSPTRLRRSTIARDPILRDLSPTKTLRALGVSSHTGTETDLMKSVERVNEDDRAFGVRVAQTCKDLREWAVEVEAWEWPGTFEPPRAEDRASERQRLLADHHVPQSHLSDDTNDEDDGFWGSLPRELVLAYEARIDAIQQAMEGMDVEGLKDHVRNVHILPKSNSPKQDEYVSFRVRSVDDYTTLVTATILQALPYLSWLSRLLHEWSVRLLVLRKVPGFLSSLAETQQQLHAAWTDLSADTKQSRDSAISVRDRFESMQTVLASKVSAVGQRLDRMLDEVQGRSESLPDTWIDRFDTLEFAYSDWVVAAKRIVTVPTWDFDLPSETATVPECDALGIITESETPSHAAESYELEAVPITSATVAAIDAERRVESPTLGERPWQRTDSISTLDRPIRLRQDSEIARLVDTVIFDSQDQAVSPIVEERAGSPTRSLTLMTKPLPPPPEPESVPPPRSPSKSPRSRARHVPIEVEAYREAAIKAGITAPPGEEEPFSLNREPPLPAPTEDERIFTSMSTIAARRAVFNGELEKKQTLLKASSPVRPFEHASTAFTKLFKSSSREPSRSGSNAGRSILKKMSPTLDKGRASFNSNRASLHSLDAGSTRGRARKVADGTSPDDRELSPSPERIVAAELWDLSPERGAQAPQQVQDWSDKEVVPARPLSEASAIQSPGRFDSPMVQNGRMSGNWPLPVKMADEEISSPSVVIGTEAFEQMFVDTLPVSPVLGDAYDSNLATFDAYIERTRMDSIIPDSVLHDHFVDGVYNHTIEDLKGRKARKKQSARHHRRLKSEDAPSRGHESSSALRSQTSTPEVHDAASVGFFKPQEIITPRTSRIIKKKSKRDKYDIHVAGPSKKRSQESTKARVYIDGDNDADRSASDKDAIKSPKVASRRASLAALEEHAQTESANQSLARDEYTIQHSRQISATDGHLAQTAHHANTGRERSDTTRSEPAFPVPPSMPPNHLRTLSAKDTKSLLQPLRSDSERSIEGHNLGATKPQPLAFGRNDAETMAGADFVEGSESEAETEQHRPQTPAQSEMRRESTASSRGDYMDQHVSKVLNKVTTKIRFSTRAGRSTPRPNTPSRDSNRTPEQGRQNRGFILSPASPPEASLKRHVKDGETKLYHLSQPGEKQPVKLFVRLVGRDERVMVRVGGGWMDLEEFLRRYAEHHPHRTVTESAVEVTEAARVESSKKRTPELQPGFSPRPGSAHSLLDAAARSPDPSSSPLRHNTMITMPTAYEFERSARCREDATPPSEVMASPTSQPSEYFDAMAPAAQPGTPNRNSVSQLRANPLFPKIVNSPVAARSRTSSLGGITPAATTSATSLSMGPGTPGRSGLDAQKARWVEDMVAQARQSTSGEKGGEWRDLGRVGSTTRLASSPNLGGGVGPYAARDKREGRYVNKW